MKHRLPSGESLVQPRSVGGELITALQQTSAVVLG